MPKVYRARFGVKAFVLTMLAIGATSPATNAQISSDVTSPHSVVLASDREVAVPDLSVYDAQALREIVGQLYRVIAHLNHELSQTNQLQADLVLLKAENARLRSEYQNSRVKITPQPREGIGGLRVGLLPNRALPERIQSQSNTSIFPTKRVHSNAAAATHDLEHTPWKYSYRPGLIHRNGEVVAMEQEKGHIWIGPIDNEDIDSDQVVIMGEFTNLSESAHCYWIVIKVSGESKSSSDHRGNTAIDREIGSWPYRTPVLEPNQTHRFEVKVPITEPVMANARNRVEVEVIPVLP